MDRMIVEGWEFNDVLKQLGIGIPEHLAVGQAEQGGAAGVEVRDREELLLGEKGTTKTEKQADLRAETLQRGEQHVQGKDRKRDVNDVIKLDFEVEGGDLKKQKF